MGGIYSDPNRTVIHFGSAIGSQFGTEANREVEDFQRKHPEFIIQKAWTEEASEEPE